MNPVLEKYIPVANLIADTFGPYCEVVIHDLDIPENSVVYTRNNQVTNREVGQSFNHLITHVLLSQDFHNDCTSNYITHDPSGRKIKSSTAILRDDNNKAVGALCVNIDVSAFEIALDYLKNMLPPTTEAVPLPQSEEIEVIPNVQEIVDELIDKVIKRHDLKNLNRDERISIIRFLQEKGVFSIKGSIDKVAEKLGVSKITIYSYINEGKK